MPRTFATGSPHLFHHFYVRCNTRAGNGARMVGSYQGHCAENINVVWSDTLPSMVLHSTWVLQLMARVLQLMKVLGEMEVGEPEASW